MSLRRRVVLLTAAALSAVLLLAGGLAYLLVRKELYDQLDSTLRARAAVLAPVVAERRLTSPQLPIVAVPGEYVQALFADGSTARPPYQALVLPATADERAVARGEREPVERTVRSGGVELRVVTAGAGPGAAVQVARPTASERATLRRLRNVFLLLTASGFLASLALGLWIAETALAPVRRLTQAAERIAATRDLAVRLREHGTDEVARLSRSFNAMLAALERSLTAQRRLVADASHEFRTPLTSIRTNVEVLERTPGLDDAERVAILRDVVAQLDELAALVDDVIELARDGERPEGRADVDLAAVVAAAVERTHRRSPDASFATDLRETVVHGDPERLERAVLNLLANAVTWSPRGARIDVTVRDGTVVVRDRGPGIADADLPLVFERFYRAPDARGTPGSGLGLAIVRQVAESHGGSVEVGNASDGGAVFTLRLAG